MPRIVLDKADGANIKMRWSCIDILEEIRIRADYKIEHKKIKEPMSITILPDGDFNIK